MCESESARERERERGTLTRSSSFSSSRFSECWRHTHTHTHRRLHTVHTHTYLRACARACILSLPQTQYPRFGSACGRFVRTSARAASRGKRHSTSLCVTAFMCSCVSLSFLRARALSTWQEERAACVPARTHKHSHTHTRTSTCVCVCAYTPVRVQTVRA